MLKFIRGKGHHVSSERLKVQKELFAFRKAVAHGFPSKPTALGYCRQLGLVAIANKTGSILVLGQPGVEFSGQHPQNDEIPVTRIIFVPQSARIITLCDDNSLHLWQLHNGTTVLQLLKSYSLEGKLKKISSVTVRGDGQAAYIGTEGGNVYTLELEKFEIGNKIIYLDVVLQNGPENYKLNPGAVEAILEVDDENQLIIGYERGLVALWDLAEQKNLKNFVSSQQLEDLAWVEQEKGRFASAHNDGSYILWDISTADKPFKDATTPYGPFPCKRIGKVRFWRDTGGDLHVAFSGGMPRASFGDHFTVTVKSEGPPDDVPHVTFDLTSKIIDFELIYNPFDDDNVDDAHQNQDTPPIALVILAEEETVFIDLESETWPTFFPQPYLNSIHPSAVTCFQLVPHVSDEVFNALHHVGIPGEFSKMVWPVRGGKVTANESTPTTTTNKKGPPLGTKSVLLSGHEDGSVRFWDATGSCLNLITKFNSSVLFNSSEDGELGGDISKDEDDEEWPPFRKVGIFDPYSDDPRLAVKKLGFCPKTGVLVIGGTAGQIVLVTCTKKKVIFEEVSKLEITTCNLVATADGFVWKGHENLNYNPKNNPNLSDREDCFAVAALLQVQPPAAITALALEAPFGVVAVGTAHGVLLFDFVRKKVVMAKSTLNPNDVMAAGDTPISRRKSIKKSLRESFRRLRKGRSQRAPSGSSPVKSPSMATVQSHDAPSKPLERAIEARGSDESMSSMVRSVTFAKTYIISLQTTTATLWAGTHAGTVFVFTVNIPGGERRLREDASCLIAKEIQLKHRAPVLSIHILDCNANQVDGFSPAHDHLGPHKVLIASEEQLKIFTLPALRPFGKLKLTAQEGSRIRKVGVQRFSSIADGCYSESCLSCLTNQGDIYVITIPELRKQMLYSQCLRREDITGIASLVFNNTGEALYQFSSSQLQRVSFSARDVTRPHCTLTGLKNPLPPVSNHVEEENAVNESKHAAVSDELSVEMADITIDSVRDLTSNPHTISSSSIAPPSSTAASTTKVVEERLIDGGSLLNPGVTNQIKSVTTVTTTTVVNSVPIPSSNHESNSTSHTTTTTSSTEIPAAVITRAPLAEVDEDTRGSTEL